jgi:PKD repeat protein
MEWEEVLFDASASIESPYGEIITYQWDWENDGIWDDTSFNPTITHVYKSPGLRYVQLKVANFTNSDTLNEPLEIDVQELPEHGWAKTWGGVSWDIAYSVDIGPLGEIYISGFFVDIVDFDPDPDKSDEHTGNPYWDCYLSKFSPDGAFQWARTWGGGGGYNDASRVAVDSSGNAYVSGQFNGLVDFNPDPDINESRDSGSDTDVFICKFDTNRNFMWVCAWDINTSWEGYLMSRNGFDIDSFGNSYFFNYFIQTVDFDPGPGEELHDTSEGHLFLSKFNPMGNFEWVQIFDVHPSNICYSICTDPLNNIYITGCFSYIDDFDPGPNTDERTPVGSTDAFLSKFDNQGNYEWVRTWGGFGTDLGQGITASSSNVWVVGTCDGIIDFNPDPDIIDEQGVEGSVYSPFISMFDSNGIYQWAKAWGSPEEPGPTYDIDVSIDNSGNAYATGIFAGAMDFNPDPDIEDLRTSNGWCDMFLCKYNFTGDYQWARTWGGVGEYAWSAGNGVATNQTGFTYVTGLYYNTIDFDPGQGVDEHTSNGGEDSFLLKVNSDGYWYPE